MGRGIKNSLSLIELFDILEKELGIKMNYKKLPWRVSDQNYFMVDIRKLKKYFKWEPKILVQEGINNILVWKNGENISSEEGLC